MEKTQKNISATFIAAIIVLIVILFGLEPSHVTFGEGFNEAPFWLVLTCYVVAGVISFWTIIKVLDSEDDGYFFYIIIGTLGFTLFWGTVLGGGIMWILLRVPFISM